MRYRFKHLSVAVVAILYLASCESPHSEYRGKISDITWNKKSYRPGETAVFRVRVENDSPKKHHYLLAFEVKGPNDIGIFDSHQGSIDQTHDNDECIAFSVQSGESSVVGPFRVSLPKDAPVGTYHAFAGLRIHPWDPLVQFRGLEWCKPEEVFQVIR